MASIRDLNVQAIADRLTAELTVDDWAVTRRTGTDVLNLAKKVAVVIDSGEDPVSIDSMTTTKDVRVSVAIFGKFEDVDPVVHAGDAMRYLDELLADVERAIFSDPDLGTRQVINEGTEKGDPEESTMLSGQLRLSIRYRHNNDDPSTYDPMVVI